MMGNDYFPMKRDEELNEVVEIARSGRRGLPPVLLSAPTVNYAENFPPGVQVETENQVPRRENAEESYNHSQRVQ